MPDADPRTIPDIMAAIASDLSNLVRTEGALVRQEVSDKVSGIARAGIGLAVGGALLWGAYLCVLAAIVIGLSYLMPAGWAALLVGVVTGLVGATVLRGAAKRMKPSELVPERSIGEVRRNVQAAKDAVT